MFPFISRFIMYKITNSMTKIRRVPIVTQPISNMMFAMGFLRIDLDVSEFIAKLKHRRNAKIRGKPSFFKKNPVTAM